MAGVAGLGQEAVQAGQRVGVLLLAQLQLGDLVHDAVVVVVGQAVGFQRPVPLGDGAVEVLGLVRDLPQSLVHQGALVVGQPAVARETLEGGLGALVVVGVHRIEGADDLAHGPLAGPARGFLAGALG